MRKVMGQHLHPQLMVPLLAVKCGLIVLARRSSLLDAALILVLPRAFQYDVPGVFQGGGQFMGLTPKLLLFKNPFGMFLASYFPGRFPSCLPLVYYIKTAFKKLQKPTFPIFRGHGEIRVRRTKTCSSSR